MEKPDGIVVVTGAARGMGEQCARLMVAAGWKRLLLLDMREEGLQAVAGDLRAQGLEVNVLACDITDASFPGVLFDRLGAAKVAALIHAAGVAPHLSTTEQVFDINLDASLRLICALPPHMAEGSAAVFFASIAGHLPVTPEAEAAFEQPLPDEGSTSLRHFATDSNAAYLLGKRAVIAEVKRAAKPFAAQGARVV